MKAIAVSPAIRRALLGAALAISLGLAFWLGREPAPDIPPTPARNAAEAPGGAGEAPGRPAAPGTAATDGLSLERPAAMTGDKPIRDLFPSQSWVPPPAPQAERMPELPFTYIGKLIQDGRTTVYLETQDRHLAVRQGDVIDGVWKVKRVAPPEMTLIYLPLRHEASLDIGRAQ